MAERLIRIGKVSSIDYANGMISVTYPDMDGATTDNFPVFSLTDEYKMPGIGRKYLCFIYPTDSPQAWSWGDIGTKETHRQ